MHIVFISNEYPIWASGGKGTFIQTFGRALVSNGHSATVLGIGVNSKREELKDEGVRLIRLSKARLPKGRYIENFAKIRLALKKIHRRQPIDIVETSELDCAYLPKRMQFKKVIRLHGGHHFFAEAENRGIDPVKGKREKKSFANADGFIAVSNYVKTHTGKFLEYHGKAIEVIPSPVVLENDVATESRDENRILFAGTVCEKKGVNQLIGGFVEVRKIYPQKELHIFGRDWKFPNGDSYIDFLKEKYSPEDLKGVFFHGSIPRPQLNTEYAKAAFCVFPSHMETQGLVTIEAMLLGTAVIFSKYGPGPEAITHLETGLLCDALDPQDIAKQMLWFIEHPKEIEKMGEAGRVAALEKYDLQQILDRNINFYTKLKNT